jgi:hypothetical protein
MVEIDQHAVDLARRIPGAGGKNAVALHQNRK